MSRKLLKIPKDEAIKKINEQISKGTKLLEDAAKVIENNGDYYSRNLQKDNYILEFDYWHAFTKDVLREVFEVSTYSYEFEKHRSEAVPYSESTITSKMNYILGALLVPKISYLQMLSSKFDEFEYSNKETNKNISPILIPLPANQVKQENNIQFDKMTLSELFRILNITQIVKIAGFVIALLSGSFYLGLYFQQWKFEKENRELTLQLENAKKEKDILLFQKDSLARLNDVNKKDTVLFNPQLKF
jgi:uncharacterized membrane protein YciS (DUF1049 family)